jgi:hypothetical protein
MRLDLAYFVAAHEAAPGLTLTGGKMHNPFFKPGGSELLWDSDWNPEGGVVRFDKDWAKADIALIGAGLWIDERSSDKDSWLGAAQGVFRYRTDEKGADIAVGVAFFDYVNSSGYAPFFDPGEPMGNTVDSNLNEDSTYSYSYVHDYQLLELYGEVGYRIGKVPFTVMGDYVTNTAADSLNAGWLAGIRVGKTQDPGSWSFRYVYRDVKKDAVVGTFTDSDFRGGGTDAKGHEIGGSLQLAKNTAFNVTYFMNTIGLEDEESDFGRLQVDLQLKFK